MKPKTRNRRPAATARTVVGEIDRDVLAFTAGDDVRLDLALAAYDCIGTAAHVTMLARMPVRPPVLTAAQARAVVGALRGILGRIRAGRFAITLEDQDVHMAVERLLTEQLGALGKRVHTGRSRNDQVAVDLRMYCREELLGLYGEMATLGQGLLAFARRHRRVPMAGRTHMRPAMPSSVGVWASAYAEALADAFIPLRAAYTLANRSPLGSAAGYGVPLPLDRAFCARLLGFDGVIHNVLHAANSRGALEFVVLSALANLVLVLSRLAEDLVLYSAPEFGYFDLPAAYCTGSSIMPQKKNPDILELVRARAARLLADAGAAGSIVRALAGGYNRDLQETKELLMRGLTDARRIVRILAALVPGIGIDSARLRAGFDGGVFAADRALELVAQGMPFRDAYRHVRENLAELDRRDPREAIRVKTHEGATAGLDFGMLAARLKAIDAHAGEERRRIHRAWSRLLGGAHPAR